MWLCFLFQTLLTSFRRQQEKTWHSSQNSNRVTMGMIQACAPLIGRKIWLLPRAFLMLSAESCSIKLQTSGLVLLEEDYFEIWSETKWPSLSNSGIYILNWFRVQWRFKFTAEYPRGKGVSVGVDNGTYIYYVRFQCFTGTVPCSNCPKRKKRECVEKRKTER